MADYAQIIIVSQFEETMNLFVKKFKKIISEESDWCSICRVPHDKTIICGEAKNPLVGNIVERMRQEQYAHADAIVMMFMREQAEFWSVYPIHAFCDADKQTYWRDK